MPQKNYLITFPSTHYALKAEANLKRNGFKVNLIPIPRDISSDCGIALTLQCLDLQENVRNILKREGIIIENIFKE